MGSVQSNIECPQCKNPHAMEDLYYKSDEVYVFCDNCGYHYERTIRRNNDGKLILKCPECEHVGISTIKGEITIKGKDLDKIRGDANKKKIAFVEKDNAVVFKPELFKHDVDKLLLKDFAKDLDVKVDDNINNYCSKCNYLFDNIWDVIIYDEIEEKGKGSITTAGILFDCPVCGETTCPSFKDGVYHCRNSKCGKPFDRKTADEMIKRKKVSGVHSVSQLPEKTADEMIQEWIDELNDREDIVIIKKQIWNGKKYEE